MTERPLDVAVFASGGGTNFQALLDHTAGGGAAWRVAVLVCNRAAGAIERAAAAGVPSVVVPTKDRASDEIARETLDVLERHSVGAVLLAGYLKLLPAEVVCRYPGRILNIHPALLPEFGGKGMFGMHVHRAVVESGATHSGATVHLVDEVYDRGEILAQARVDLEPSDDPDDVARKVLEVEHRLYPLVVDHVSAAVAAGRAVEPLGEVDLERAPEPQPSPVLTEEER